MDKPNAFQKLGARMARLTARKNWRSFYLFPSLFALGALIALCLWLWLKSESKEGRAQQFEQELIETNAEKQLLIDMQKIDSLFLHQKPEEAQDLALQLSEGAPKTLQKILDQKRNWWRKYRSRVAEVLADSQSLGRQLHQSRVVQGQLRQQISSLKQSAQDEKDSLMDQMMSLERRLSRVQRELEAKSEKQFLSFYSSKGARVYYLGESQAGKAHGEGVGIWKTGSKYEGQWENNRRHGQGTFEWAEGEKYEGEFRNDKRHGHGTYYWLNGDKYVGNWENDLRNGQGTFYNREGQVVAKGRWAGDELVERAK